MRALVRKGSESKLPPGCTLILGNALDEGSFAEAVSPADTFVQLIGVPHPSPSKAREFQDVDLVSVRASVSAAKKANIRHFVYVSVAQPAPIMKAYQGVRAQGETLIRKSGLDATILRPWYVLGPGHRWPYLLIPVYWILKKLPATREGANRMGLLSLSQMIQALNLVIRAGSHGYQVLDVPKIRELGKSPLFPPGSHKKPQPTLTRSAGSS